MAQVKWIRRAKKDRPPKPKPAYLYQTDNRYFAQIADSVKDAGAMELRELGAKDVRPVFSGIRFRADHSALYRINYQSRLISRCLAPLAAFSCPDTDTLYRKAKQIRWEDFFEDERTFAVFANVSGSAITHSKYASLRLKDAVVDYCRGKIGSRPNVSVRDPDVPLNLHIREEQAIISLDASGGALHRRGYREESVAAPMQETVAAAIIHLSEWDGGVPLYDPMCGSGTLLCEALMRVCRIPAGIFRERFGFEAMPDFDAAAWRRVKSEADSRIRTLPAGQIAGSDISSTAIDAARTNLLGIHHGNRVCIEQADFRNLPEMPGCVIVANPPYGIRMGENDDLDLFYKDLGDFLKQKCQGSIAYIFFGDRAYVKKVGLKASWKKPLKAGGLDGRLVKYEMY